MRLEDKNTGTVLHLEGTWLEISNKYGVHEYGDVTVDPEDVPGGYAEKRLLQFISRHSVAECENLACVKRVAFVINSGAHIQLQAILPAGDEFWVVQKFDNELVYMGEIKTGCRNRSEVITWLRSTFEIESCLPADVYRSSFGDCTNGGISSAKTRLYIISKMKGPFEANDIRECVYVERKNVCGEDYIDCKPLYFQRRWYMAGGNFLYTSDSRFREITGSKYPISIHDRYEGR